MNRTQQAGCCRNQSCWSRLIPEMAVGFEFFEETLLLKYSFALRMVLFPTIQPACAGI
jgi:hypothetical protein